MGTYVEPSDVKDNRVSTRVRTRKLDRSVAHNRMKRGDLRKVNKHDYNTYRTFTGMIVQERNGSYFSSHWREVANEELNNM